MNPQTFDEALDILLAAQKELLIQKHKDYGPYNVLACPIGVSAGIIVRVSDKIQRISHLLKNQASPQNESLIDSWMDIVNYGCIAQMVDHGWFELPLSIISIK